VRITQVMGMMLLFSAVTPSFHVRHRNVHDRVGFVVESLIPYVAYNSDNFARRFLELRPHTFADGDALPDWIAVWPELLCQPLVDQHYSRCAPIIAIREHPPADQRDFEHIEVPR